MARLARVIAVGVPHHVTQRGNARQYILSHDADRSTYLDLVRRYCLLHKLAVLGYCLRSNHVHLIVIPSESHSLAQALKQAHGRYATHWNVTHGSSRHVWQGRFYSCPLDAAPLWMALRYSERNPVRAGLVDEAHQWAWSSAAIHCGAQAPEDFLDLGMWRRRWTVSAWRNYLSTEESEADLSDLRRCTHTGRPLGSQEFIAAVEKSTQRQLVPQKGGRPVSVADNRQGGFPFEQ